MAVFTRSELDGAEPPAERPCDKTILTTEMYIADSRQYQGCGPPLSTYRFVEDRINSSALW